MTSEGKDDLVARRTAHLLKSLRCRLLERLHQSGAFEGLHVHRAGRLRYAEGAGDLIYVQLLLEQQLQDFSPQRRVQSLDDVVCLIWFEYQDPVVHLARIPHFVGLYIRFTGFIPRPGPRQRFLQKRNPEADDDQSSRKFAIPFGLGSFLEGDITRTELENHEKNFDTVYIPC